MNPEEEPEVEAYSRLQGERLTHAHHADSLHDSLTSAHAQMTDHQTGRLRRATRGMATFIRLHMGTLACLGGIIAILTWNAVWLMGTNNRLRTQDNRLRAEIARSRALDAEFSAFMAAAPNREQALLGEIKRLTQQNQRALTGIIRQHDEMIYALRYGRGKLP